MLRTFVRIVPAVILAVTKPRVRLAEAGVLALEVTVRAI